MKVCDEYCCSVQWPTCTNILPKRGPKRGPERGPEPRPYFSIYPKFYPFINPDVCPTPHLAPGRSVVM